jgi:putative Ca2+/H+ antiporter (TMEM165/GDT1 family)
MIDWSLFASTFALIFFAELPDKTALATVMMATRGRPFAIFVGVAAAFFIQSVVAVAFGGWIGRWPESYVHIGAGLLFVAFGVQAWFFQKDDQTEAEVEASQVSPRGQFLKNSWQAFLVIFIAEWGDITQIATASLAARRPDQILAIFLSSVLALWLVTALAILLGRKVRHWIQPRKLKALSAIIFLLVGAYFIYEGLMALGQPNPH